MNTQIKENKTCHWYQHSYIHHHLIIMHNIDTNTTRYTTLMDAAKGRNVSLSGSIVSLVGFHREYYNNDDMSKVVLVYPEINLHACLTTYPLVRSSVPLLLFHMIVPLHLHVGPTLVYFYEHNASFLVGSFHALVLKESHCST